MTELPDRFLHGSYDHYHPGFTLTPRREGYQAAWKHADFYAALERWRPEGKLAHKDAVFLAGSLEDVELAGGSTVWCMECEPVGEVSRHDVNWGSEVARLVSEGYEDESDEIRAAAEAYWSGKPHHSETVWEYLAPAAKVLSCKPFESFDMERAPAPRF